MHTSPSPFDVIPRYEIRSVPRTDHLFRVEVQIIGQRICHVWTGWACDSSQASKRGREDARSIFRGYGLCVRNVLQVGI